MSDTIEQHQEQQPSVSEGSLEPADGCCPTAVAAPERVRVGHFRRAYRATLLAGCPAPGTWQPWRPKLCSTARPRR